MKPNQVSVYCVILFTHHHNPRKYKIGQERWLMPVIPALWEVKEGRSRGQKIETILANMVKPVFTKNRKISWAWQHAPVVPATREAEAGEC